MDEQMKRKNNLKLYPIYKMFSWDLLFYYAINFLFLTTTKGISASQILFVDAFYPLFKILFQIPCVTLIDYIGKKKALLLGNIFVSISILTLILGKGISALFISNLIQSLGAIIKDLCEPTLLHDSIPESKGKANIFSKLDGKGFSNHFLLSSISSIITGFLFVVNSYLPIILCFVFCLISTLIASGLQEIENKEVSTKSSGFQNAKIYFRDLKHAFKFIFKSSRLKSLLIFSSLMYGFINIFDTLKGSLLTHLNVPAQYFGLIQAAALFAASISSQKQQWFHETCRNRALTWFSLPIAFSLILTGLLVICNFNINILYCATALMILLLYAIKGPYYTLVNRYYNNFSNPDINTKIYSAKSLIESFARAALCFFASFLLGISSIAYALVILGCLLTVTFIFLLDYMKTRIGLKPEEYKKKDIEFSILK